MDALEKEITSNLLGENYSEFETKKQKAKRIAKQEEEYKRQTAGLNLTVPKLDRDLSAPKAPLTKFAESQTTRSPQNILEKGIGALGAILNLTNPAPVAAETEEEKKILGMQPSTFWMVLGGLTLTTLAVIAVKSKTAKN